LQEIAYRDLPVSIMPHSKIWIYPVSDAPALFFLGDISVGIQVGDYLPYGPLGDADIFREFSGSDTRLFCNETKN
jgi:hypothetical protein